MEHQNQKFAALSAVLLLSTGVLGALLYADRNERRNLRNAYDPAGICAAISSEHPDTAVCKKFANQWASERRTSLMYLRSTVESALDDSEKIELVRENEDAKKSYALRAALKVMSEDQLLELLKILSEKYGKLLSDPVDVEAIEKRIAIVSNSKKLRRPDETIQQYMKRLTCM